VLVEDAVVIACGEGEYPVVGKDCERIDLKGRFITPGLEDSHVHFYGTGLLEKTIDLTGVSSKKEAISKISEAIEKSSEGVVAGRGWNNNVWEDPEFICKDIPETSRPVVLLRVDGHALLINSVVMKECGIGRNSEDVPGGKIDRDFSGDPTGILIDRAMDPVLKKYNTSSEEELEGIFNTAQKKFFENGIVKVHDMGINVLHLDFLKKLYSEEKLKIKNYSFLDPGDDFNFTGKFPSFKTKNFESAGIKLYSDGAFGSGGAYLLSPYMGTESRGLCLLDEHKFSSLIDYSIKNNIQLAIHAIGDGAIKKCLEGLLKFKDTIKGRRFRIEHAAMVDLEDARFFEEMDLIASIQPCHYISDIPWLGKFLSDRQIKKVYNWDVLRQSGVSIAVGTDSPVEPVNPLKNFIAGIERGDMGFSPLEVLSGYTRGSARSSFKEKRRGKIKKGFDADFTIFSKNPLEGDFDNLRIEGVILDGVMI